MIILCDFGLGFPKYFLFDNVKHEMKIQNFICILLISDDFTVGELIKYASFTEIPPCIKLSI